MNFTFDDYRKLIYLLLKHNYSLTNYYHYKNVGRSCILRHDIDQSPEKALVLARVEAEMNVNSTYFVLLTSDFYNVFSSNNRKILKEIASLGHTIGLHFDEVAYTGNNINTKNINAEEYKTKIIELIQEEANALTNALGLKIDTVSMHRPSKFCLECNLKIPGIINSYGQDFFQGFKYLSDSRRCWREDVLRYIQEEKYERLHILTHAFWYHETETSLKDTLTAYLEKAKSDRYEILDRNFTHLQDALAGKD